MVRHCGLSAQGCSAIVMCGQGDARSMALADIGIGADMHEMGVHARKA